MGRQQDTAPGQRLVETWHQHPKWTLGAIAAAVGIVSSVTPIALAALHYFTTHDEFIAHQKHDESKDAWNAVQEIRLESLMARNRVNDCNVATEKRVKMTDIERTACQQYMDELKDAQSRYEAARVAAMATTKEK